MWVNSASNQLRGGYVLCIGVKLTVKIWYANAYYCILLNMRRYQTGKRNLICDGMTAILENRYDIIILTLIVQFSKMPTMTKN